MTFPGIPTTEDRRLRVLEEYGDPGNEGESSFDDLTALAAATCHAPIALITLIDETTQWCKSSYGIEMDHGPREHTFCSHTILGNEVLVVPDATKDERFRDNPCVTGPPHSRFYAGAPLLSPEGEAIGTICIIDTDPREPDPTLVSTLERLARQVMAQLELRRRLGELSFAKTARELAEEALRVRESGAYAHLEADKERTSMPVVFDCILSLAITLIATWVSISHVRRDREAVFVTGVEEFVSQLLDRLSAYEELERAAAAFVSSSDRVTGPEWDHFIQNVAIERRYPGLGLTGLVRQVPSTGLDEFLLQMREENPDFELHPRIERDDHYVVCFVSPSDPDLSALGFDIASDRPRHLAALIARDTGSPRATERLTLLHDVEDRTAIMLFYPIYRKGVPVGNLDERRAALIGWIFLGVRIQDLVERLPISASNSIAFDLHEADGQTPEPLFESDWKGSSTHRATRSFDVYGQTWNLTAVSRPELFETAPWSEPTAVLLGGLLFSGLITAIAWSLSTTRRRALEIAGDVTEAYERSENFTRAIVDGIDDGTLTIEQNGVITSVNRATERILGLPPSQLLGANVTTILSPLQLDAAEGVPFALNATRSDGQSIEIEVVFNSLSGDPTQRLVIIRDATERNRSERETRLLQSLSFWITQSSDLDEAIRTVLEELCSLARWPYAEAWLPDEHASCLIPGPSWHREDGKLDLINETQASMKYSKGEGLPGHVWESRKPRFVRHLSEKDLVAPRTRAVLDSGLRAALAVPVLADEEVVAIMVFFAPETTEEIERYTKLVTATASQLGSAIQRKRASDALVESHNALGAVLDAATEVSIIATDLDGMITVFNQGAERMLGYTADEMIGHRTPEIIHLGSELRSHGTVLSEQLRREVRGFNTVVESARRGVVKEREWTYVRADGEHLTVTLAVNALRNADGKVIGFLCVAKDITIRNRAIHELRSSESRVRSIIESSLGGVLTFDRMGIIESVNPAAEAMFGYSETELIGRHFTVLVPTGEESPSDFRASKYSGAIGRVTEWKGRRRNGEVFSVEVSLFEFSSTAQINFAGHIVDVSKRQEVDRLKRDFVSTVSHELRTPLTSIRGALGLLASGSLGDLQQDAREMVSVAERNSIRLIDLINDILDFERLESGRMELHPRRTLAKAVVARSLENVRTFADQANITIEVDRDEGVMMADEDRTVQVLVNLLSNAIKFSPAGSTITIRTTPVNGYIECRVIDRGKGISLESQQRLFRRFQQVDSSDRREKGGTGLGLAISKAIVEQHQGEIGVESELGQGSSFWFRLPRVGEVHSERRDILAIEGDDALLRVMKKQLDSEQISLRFAHSCSEGLLSVNEHTPDLIILDVGLPDGDAYGLVEELRHDKSYQDIPVLVYTGRDLTYDQKNLLRLGSTRFLMKSKAPVDELRHVMLELLNDSEERSIEGADHR